MSRAVAPSALAGAYSITSFSSTIYAISFTPTRCSNPSLKRTASQPLSSNVSPLQNYLCRPAFIPAFCLSQRFSLLGLVLALGFACKCSAGFKPFWPPAPVLLALEALSLVAFRGCVALCLTPSGLTRQSSGPAKGGPLTLVVRPSILPLYAGPHLFQRFAFLKRFSAGVLAVWRASPGACALFQAF